MRALALVALAGCLEPDLVVCASGIACPANLVCADELSTCVAPDDLAACEGKATGDSCREMTGACYGGVCQPIGCGNDRLDPGERCDDGNTLDLDGCSADCRSDETCNNGTVDARLGEVCDDGNFTSHDGCDSGCRVEEPDWIRDIQLDQHPARFAGGYAYDTARERLVYFGGVDENVVRVNTTFEWDGANQTWLDRSPTLSPTARLGPAMAYDVERGVTLLFGGSQFDGATSETWRWDGERWALVDTPVHPPARFNAQMVYDPKRKRTVMFGGRNVANVDTTDTWIWDGAAWSPLATPREPPPRERGAFAYDPIRDELVLAAGVNFSTIEKSTWILANDDWRDAEAPVNETRIGPALVFDPHPAVGRLRLIGGTVGNDALWDGTAWTLDTEVSPLARPFVAGYFDRRADAVIAGLGATGNAPDRSMSSRAGGAWGPVGARGAPSNRIGAMTAFDARRGRVVMFGGFDVGNRGDTFEVVDGSSWIDRGVAGPDPRARGAIAYDAARGRIVVWGGLVTDDKVWEWDGDAWESRTPAGPKPLARLWTDMAYVPGVGCVMFGGGTNQQTVFNDTWIWDGASWTETTDVTRAPRKRWSHAMEYDPARGEIVMFGGADDTVRLGDTWTWTPAGGWSQRTPSTTPNGRSRAGMSWDPIRGRMYLFGGIISTLFIDETWAWDGTTWTQLFTDHRPAPQSEPTLVFDGIAGRTLAHGSDGTWHLGWRSATKAEACLTAIDRDGDGRAGCADPDCAPFCSPLCPPSTSCTTPHCGDATCDAVENCRLCPDDCGVCAVRCGDFTCATDEASTCPGDCP